VEVKAAAYVLSIDLVSSNVILLLRNWPQNIPSFFHISSSSGGGGGGGGGGAGGGTNKADNNIGLYFLQ
jgi:hypothetical protein